MKTRIEANVERSGRGEHSNLESRGGRGEHSNSRGEQEGPVYYGMNSTARRSSQDFPNKNEKTKTNVINDDLADEIEAIRLAADFSSRRMLNDQKKEPTAGSASSSRLRIRALLDKQTKQRVSTSRPQTDMHLFLCLYFSMYLYLLACICHHLISCSGGR